MLTPGIMTTAGWLVGLVGLLLLSSTGCKKNPWSTSATTPDGGVAPTGSVQLDLSEASVHSVLSAVSKQTGVPIAIDVDAQPLARCVRIGLVAPVPVPAEQALRLLSDTLGPSALSLTRTNEGWILRRIPDRPLPPSCERLIGSTPSLDPSSSLPGAPMSPALAAAIAEGVRRVDDRNFEVTKKAREVLLSSHAEWTRSMRMVPSVQEGKPGGLKLFGIRSRSVPSQLGLHNGDVVTTVCGLDMSSPEKALEAYSLASKQDVVEVGLIRRGEAMVIRYRAVK